MSKRGVETYQARRRAEGWVKATVWLSPEAVAALAKEAEYLTRETGTPTSRDWMINRAIEDNCRGAPITADSHAAERAAEVKHAVDAIGAAAEVFGIPRSRLGL